MKYKIVDVWFPSMELDFINERNELISMVKTKLGKKKHKYIYSIDLYNQRASLVLEVNGKKRREFKGTVFSCDEEKKIIIIDYDKNCYFHQRHSVLNYDILKINEIVQRNNINNKNI